VNNAIGANKSHQIIGYRFEKETNIFRQIDLVLGFNQAVSSCFTISVLVLCRKNFPGGRKFLSFIGFGN